ncbi:unnamed protein product [Rotaria sp. Silwood1]|nr:unnamed protein product [Rotaria sp. Silwood1]
MLYNNVVLILLIVSWLCSVGSFTVVASKRSIKSHITGGYKNSLAKKNASQLDCSQVNNDYDVLRQFPFPILVNPIELVFDQSTATMDENNTFVKKIYIYQEEVVPSSVFCLSKLQALHVEMTPFQNGIVPDTLANLKLLRNFWIYNSPIFKMSEQLETLTNLLAIVFRNCSLTHLPKFSKLERLWNIDLFGNRLSEIDEIPSVLLINLRGNRFKKLPIIKKRENVTHVDMGNNPLENIESITSYINLEGLSLSNTSLTSISPAIDKLQKLTHLDLSNNQLSYFPRHILDLPHLEELNIKNNLFSSEEIQLIQKEFETSHPNAELIV